MSAVYKLYKHVEAMGLTGIDEPDDQLGDVVARCGFTSKDLDPLRN